MSPHSEGPPRFPGTLSFSRVIGGGWLPAPVPAFGGAHSAVSSPAHSGKWLGIEITVPLHKNSKNDMCSDDFLLSSGRFLSQPILVKGLSFFVLNLFCCFFSPLMS